MGLLLVLGGYFGIGSLYPPVGDATLVSEVRPIDSAPLTVPAEVTQPRSETMNAIPANQFVAGGVPARPLEAVNRTVTAEPSKRAPSRNETESETSVGGSYDEASRESIKIVPQGMDPNGFGANARKLDVKSVFSAMGISASYSTGGWIVNSASGIAQRS